MKLQEVLKGMCVKSWEVREDSYGNKRVYVRFQPKKSVEEVVVKG